MDVINLSALEEYEIRGLNVGTLKSGIFPELNGLLSEIRTCLKQKEKLGICRHGLFQFSGSLLSSKIHDKLL